MGCALWTGFRTLAVVAFCLLGTATAWALPAPDTTKPFPDDWFFEGAQRPPQLKALEGKPAPALALGEWIGTPTSLEANLGRVVVIDFWATWCGPCMASIPHNVDLVSRYGSDGLVFIGVHDSNSGWNAAPGVVKDKKINYPVAKDNGGASVKDYALQFWPTYVVIDRSGVVRAAGLTPDRVEDVVKVLLAEMASAMPVQVEAEFAAECYYGGEKRPQSLREAESKSMPTLAPAGWLGTEVPASSFTGSVCVVTFLSPALGFSLKELEKLAPIQQEMGPQGVVFAGVCEAGVSDEAWATLGEFREAKTPGIPVMLDSPRKDGAPEVPEAPAPSNASGPTSTPGTLVTPGTMAPLFGVEFLPSTYVIDRAGKIRAAGVRADQLQPILEKLLAEATPAEQ